ncbi:RNA polymerase sigma factor [Curtobacterium sp. KBS0715]|uniref:RNA polymerase sigma factor n=1 Tax=Curtobacterium sp. KBS0715 TaxID=1179671 RepID=UPI00110DC6DA|nr:sigma-70 family RNA polymerase sigma factor [Curtobacterium sp. KBS0715]TSD11631.1 sigma-70 family RNA polymerase sigma factor [Curtobacterium sp. KBS0715]
MEELTDVALIAAVTGGDRAAFGVLFDRHSPALYRYAWTVLHNNEDTLDAVQQTFLVAWKKRRQVRVVDDSALPWLLTACRFEALNLARQRRRDSERLAPLESQQTEPVVLADSDEHADELAFILSEISTQSETDQQVCRLVLREGLTYDQAAHALGLTPSAVGKKLERTRKRLRIAREKYREVTQ